MTENSSRIRPVLPVDSSTGLVRANPENGAKRMGLGLGGLAVFSRRGDMIGSLSMTLRLFWTSWDKTLSSRSALSM